MRTVMSAEPSIFPGPDDSQQMKLLIRIVRAPSTSPAARVGKVFDFRPEHRQPWTSPDAVVTRGDAIRDTLDKMAGIGDVLRSWQQTKAPLYVQVSDPLGESLNWELLYHDQKFYALDPGWPIARLTDPANETGGPPRYLATPVRLMVLISACRVDNQWNEWESIRKAVISGRQRIDIQLHVVVGSLALGERISKEIADNGLAAFCTVSGLGENSSKVVAQILDWSPNLLHIFCHGYADEYNQFLELAKATDYIEELERGTVRLAAKELRAIASQLNNPWFVALNCCSSAASSGGVQSLACRIVESGFPCAVAMVEPVDALDAFEFTDAFYPPLFRNLENTERALAAAPRATFEWTDAMWAARAALAARHTETSREWALPVMYVRGLEPFAFERAPCQEASKISDYVTTSRVVAEWLRTAAGNADEATRREVMETMLADVPRPLWPRLDGSYGPSP